MRKYDYIETKNGEIVRVLIVEMEHGGLIMIVP